MRINRNKARRSGSILGLVSNAPTETKAKSSEPGIFARLFGRGKKPPGSSTATTTAESTPPEVPIARPHSPPPAWNDRTMLPGDRNQEIDLGDAPTRPELHRGQPLPNTTVLPTAEPDNEPGIFVTGPVREGIALGDVGFLGRRDDLGEVMYPPDDQPYTLKNHENRLISVEDVQEFLEGKRDILVDSTNVYSIGYRPETEQLHVGFQSKTPDGKPSGQLGSMYEYDQISPEEAKSFLQVNSKGGWVWDELRIRGTKTGHKKAYRRIS
jgi:hypothetical protein